MWPYSAGVNGIHTTEGPRTSLFQYQKKGIGLKLLSLFKSVPTSATSTPQNLSTTLTDDFKNDKSMVVYFEMLPQH
jgi:hypothetical protein